VLRFFGPFPLAWRTGATFIHDWTALALGLAITGHVWLAVADPEPEPEELSPAAGS
jgi:formate dehydrogenase subunit gamma